MAPYWHKFEFRDLFLYCELGRLGSIREVARVHAVDASQVSRLVSALEREYGARLVERSVRGVRFTERGLDVKARFEGILALANHRLAEAAPSLTPLAIASTAFLSTRAVAPVIAGLARTGTNYSFRLVDFSPDELVGVGIQGGFEGAVHVGRLDWPRAWVTTEVGAIAWHLFCRAGHPLAGRGVLAPEDLAGHAFTQPVYWARGGLNFGNDHCPLPRDERTSGTSTSTADAAVAILRDSDELGFLPEILCRDERERGVLEVLEVRGWPEVHKPLHATFRSDAVTKRFLKTFVTALSQVIDRG